MIAAGIDLTVIAEIRGHENVNVLIRVYAHALEERKKAAASLLELAWARGAAPYPATYEAILCVRVRLPATRGQGTSPGIKRVCDPLRIHARSRAPVL